MTKPSTTLTTALILLISILLPMIAVELTLRLIDRPDWDTEILAGWKYTGKDKHVNQLRYRGQQIKYSDSDIVILLLGDSQVESEACPFEKSPEQLLERHLKGIDARFRVFTLGSGGYGNDQEYLAARHYFQNYRADAVILWQTFANDVWNNIFPTNWPKDGIKKPTFWLESGRLKGPTYQLGGIIRTPARTKIGVLLNRLLHPQKGADKSWERYLPKAYEPLTHYDGPFLTDWDPSDLRNKNPLLRDENLRTEKSHFAVQLYPRSERMQYGLDLTKKLLAKINELSRENNSRFYVFYPTLGDKKTPSADGHDIMVHRRDNSYYKTSAGQEEENQNYVNEKFGVFEVPILNDHWRVSDVDGHLNCESNDQVMRGLASHIVKSINVTEKMTNVLEPLTRLSLPGNDDIETSR